VRRIIFRNNSTTAGWVEYDQPGLRTCIALNKDVIVSAGTMRSPQILNLSGIGDQTELEKAGIPVVKHLPGVGKNFQEDLYVTVGYLTLDGKEMPDQPYGLMGLVIFYTAGGRDPSGRTNIECSLGSGTDVGMNLPPPWQKSYFIYPNMQLLKSRGTVSLNPNDPFGTPIFDPHFLEAEQDIEYCIEAIKRARLIGTSAGLDEWRGEEIIPGPTVQTDEELRQHVRSIASTCQHFAGTCRMGPQDQFDSVVDPATMRVWGFNNVRVIDASVIPETVSGNSAAATYMIGHYGAELVNRSAN